MAESRTIKSIKNAEVTIFYYFLNLLVGFWSRKVFYDYLGSEVLGLDTTASSLLGFLNLAELGIGYAVAFFLYQPMFDKDKETINEIVSLQGWIYRRIAFVIIAGAVVLMCFFPRIFRDINLPLWYAYATFLVMLFGALLGYFVNYRQCVLTTDQKGYKVSKVTSGASLLFKIVLIIILPHVGHPFLFYIGTNLLGTIFGTIWLNHILKKEYPWLQKSELSGRELLKKYPNVLKKTSQIFFHNITSFIVFRTAPLIMYAYTTLTAIAYYGNYITIIDKAKDILGMAFSSTGAGIGNLIASHDSKHIQEVYWELLDSRLCISTGFILVLALITEPFISIWLSPHYLLGKAVLIIIAFNSWLHINRLTTESFINGYGLFQDIWAPVVEAIINFSIAIIMGRIYGLAGVLLGQTASTLTIVYGWKPYFLYSRGFKLNPVKEYYLPIFMRWGLVAITAIVFIWIVDALISFPINNFWNLAIYGLILSIIIIPTVYLEFYLFTPGTRRFTARMIGLIKKRISS